MLTSVSSVFLSSGARTATQTSDDISTNGFGSLSVTVDVTAASSPSLVVTINGKDEASGKYYNILTGAALTGTGTTIYRVGPGLTAAANSVANSYLPPLIQIVVTAGNGNSSTYSVGYSLQQNVLSDPSTLSAQVTAAQVSLSGIQSQTTKTITFDGSAGLGAVGQVTALTCTGAVWLHSLTVRCTDSLIGTGATISMGRAGAVSTRIPVTTATTIDAGMIWVDGTPAAGARAIAAALLNIAVNGDITFDVLVADITAGTLVVDAFFTPITPDGNLT